MKKDSSEGRLVYSTDVGSICPECQKQLKACVCAERKQQRVQGEGAVRIRREIKGRAGKTVSVIFGLPLNQIELAGILSELKRRCGAGGTIKDGVIEIQGDHVDTLVAELSSRGFSVKRSGG